MPSFSVQSLLSKTWFYINKYLSLIQKKKVLKNKKKLSESKFIFNEYPEVLFVFQSFNKQNLVSTILRPFLELRVKNIVFFADGCIDNTSRSAHFSLKGESHFVVSCNDLHEIKNYRLALDYALFLHCKYVIFLQDDDLYQVSCLVDWINSCIKICRESDCCIIGGNGGGQVDPSFQYTKANKEISIAQFASGVNLEGDSYYQLGDTDRWLDPVPSLNFLGKSCCYAAHVNRAPQFMVVSCAKELGFFPKELEPFQYDDYWNCFTAWQAGKQVLLMPVCGKSQVGEGGMRIYNNVNRGSRPSFFSNNWNFVFDSFSNSLLDIHQKVIIANRKCNLP